MQRLSKDQIKRGTFIRGGPVVISKDAADDALEALDALAAEREALMARMDALARALAELRRSKR